MQMNWPAAIGLLLLNAVLGGAALHWWRRARASGGGNAPRWHQLEALCMTTIGVMFLGAFDLFVLAGVGGPVWLDTAAVAVVVGGCVTAGVFWVAQHALQLVEDRQDRRVRVAAGVPVSRRLWHPGVIALGWLLAVLPAGWLVARLMEWGLGRYWGERLVTAAESARVVDTLGRALIVASLVYLAAAMLHVLVQVLRRRRDDRRVVEESQGLLTDSTGLAPLPSVWLPAALAGSGRRWRWALREPVDPAEEPETLRAAPPAARWGYLALLLSACTFSLTLWCLMTVGIVTATDQPVAGRAFLAVVWVGVTAAMTNALGPDLARVLRGIVRAALHRGPAGPAGA